MKLRELLIDIFENIGESNFLDSIDNCDNVDLEKEVEVEGKEISDIEFLKSGINITIDSNEFDDIDVFGYDNDEY